ncbi:DUF2309 domain-containing protein [Rummeliibacillus sp. JY-2-4R]
MNDMVKSASKVIVPLGPINQFAARSPWAGLEDQTFEETARQMKGTCDIDIYPNEAMLKSASEQDEINQDLLKDGLKKWLDLQAFDMPREVAEQYCHNALKLNQQVFENAETKGIKELAKKLSRFKPKMSLENIVRTKSQWLDELGLGNGNYSESLNFEIIKWCKLFLDESQAVWSMPNREKGFYHAWKEMVQFDSALNHSIRKQLKNIPGEADQALAEGLVALGVPASEIQAYLEAHLLALPGWAGMMLWKSQQSTTLEALLTEYLAVRVSMEWALINSHLPLPEQKVNDQAKLESFIICWNRWGNMQNNEWSMLSPSEIKARLLLAARFDQFTRNQLWLEAWEKTYEIELMYTLTSKQSTEQKTKPVVAQFAFCIDVRSEPFRRQLEKIGPFETFGTAGFFGLPIETTKLGSKHSHESLPVMFKPQYKITESAATNELQQFKQREDAANSAGHTFKTLKQNLFSSLLLPEISGPFLSLQTLARSFVPKKAGKALTKMRKSWLDKPSTELSLNHTHHLDSELPVGFSEEEQLYYARQALKMMGLTNNFAPLVVICGHGSHSTNNPYSSSLDCGACGGASSGFNARVLAELCNLLNIRKLLANEGIIIPEETVFVAAEHNTTLDELNFIYVPELSNASKESFDCIQTKLSKVQEAASAERIVQLPTLSANHKNPTEEMQRIAEDWSEVRPEWGLARNAAFIIGDRSLTQDCNLNGRAFLHNYHWKNDINGDILSNIIAGPATVAQWINLQYYASTVAPHYYGSGNKATQTVTAGIGVMQGNASDLLTGLPWQSVMQSDNQAYHAPLRLLVVIQAPKNYVERLLKRDVAFLQKVQNGWVRLASVDENGNWKSWS